jgi:HK97 family phage prohead protease
MIERRMCADGLEVRAASDKQPPGLRGYAGKFNTLSEPLGGFREQLAPGAFDKVLADDVRCLFNHDPNQILGRTLSGTCRIGVDGTGLFYDVDLPDTQTARELSAAVARGDISGSSFAFMVERGGDEWDEQDDGSIIRTIRTLRKLVDVSPVTFPAYPDASVAARDFESAVRSMDEWRKQRAASLDTKARQLQGMSLRLRELRA